MEEAVLKIDFEELKTLYERIKEPIDIDVSEIERVDALNIDKLPEEIVEEYIKIGEKVILGEKYAVVTLAGGQRYQTRA